MTSSPPPEFSALRVGKSRQRGDTANLLPKTFDSASEALPIHPVASSSLKNYNRERYQQDLEYAQKFLMRRDISPRSEMFMAIFKEELKEAMYAETPEDKLASAGSIRTFERLIEKNGFLRAEAFTQSQEVHANLLELRELQYYSRYGDDVKIFPTALRAHASPIKTENWQILCGRFQWTQIASKLEEEKKALETMGKDRDDVIKRTGLSAHIAVRAACRDLGTNEELAIWSIIQYGLRNMKMHRDLEDLISGGKFNQLADVLQNDLDDIDCIFSEFRSGTDKEALKTIVSAQCDKWFDRSEFPEDPPLWGLRPELKAAYQKAVARKSAPNKSENETKNIAENDGQSQEKLARREAVASESSDPLVASTEFRRGSEDHRAKTKNANLVARAYRLREELEQVEKELEQDTGEEGP